MNITAEKIYVKSERPLPDIVREDKIRFVVVSRRIGRTNYKVIGRTNYKVIGRTNSKVIGGITVTEKSTSISRDYSSLCKDIIGNHKRKLGDAI